MNKIILVGNLTRDPESSVTGSGVNLCKFVLAVNRQFANADGLKEADFFDVVAWRGLADNCAKYLSKGSKVAVCGRVEIRFYENRDGVKQKGIDVVADDVEFLSPSTKPEQETVVVTDEQRKKKKTPEQLTAIADDGLPF